LGKYCFSPAFQAEVGVLCLCRRSLTCGYENPAFQALGIVCCGVENSIIERLLCFFIVISKKYRTFVAEFYAECNEI
jgi:hypothetical protein